MRTEKKETKPLKYNNSSAQSTFKKLWGLFSNVFVAALFLILSSSNTWAQTFSFNGGIANDNGTAESGVTVTAKSGGSVVETSKTSASGRYKLELPYGKNYTIEITKAGFTTRFFQVDLTNVKEENLAMGEDFATQNVVILKEVPGVNMSALTSQPITSFSFNKKSGLMEKDTGQESSSKKAEQTALAAKEKAEASGGANKAELEKQLKAKIKIGDDAMTENDFKKAQKAYLDAVDFAGKNDLDDTEAIDKLDIADDEQKKVELAEIQERQENEAFFKLLDEAKKLEAKKDYTKALAKLEEAKEKRPEHEELLALITKVNQAIAEKEAEEKLNADYQQAMADGNQLFEEKNYEEAIKKYQEAKELKPKEKDPDLKIQSAQSKLKDQQKEADKLANFEALLTEANELRDAEKFDEAIKKYEEAKVLFKDRSEPQEGIDFCKNKKKELEDLAKSEQEQAEREKNYTEAMTKADGLFAAASYQEAIKEYEKASKIKPDEELPKTQIALANEKINELADADAKQKQFDQLKKDGEQAFNKNQLIEAKDKFNQANSIIEGDAFVLDKLAAIEQLEQENADAAAKNEQYQNLITQAQNAFDEEKLDVAKNLFQQAADLKPEESLPPQKIAEIDKKLEQDAANQANKAQFDALVASANSKEAAQDLQGAIADLTEAVALIPDNQIQAKITQLQEDLNNKEQAAQRKAAYDEAIGKAEAAKNESDWEQALKLFKDAKSIDETQNYPDQQIKIIQDELDKLRGAEERLAIFQKLIADAEGHFKQKKYQDAETNYTEALSFADREEDKANAQTKLDEVKKILDELEGEARKEQAYQDAIATAQQLESEDKLTEALAKYLEAKELKPEEALPPQKETELSEILAQREKEAAAKSQFEELIAAGNQLFIGGQFEEAIAKYQEAKPIFPENPLPQEKIDEVNKKIEELANDAEEQAYQKILNDADNLRTDGKLDEAIAMYNNALKERPEDQVPINKIKEIEAEIEENIRKEAELLEKRKRYAELLDLANTEFDNNELKKALNLYTDAKNELPEEAEEATKRIEQINNLLAQAEAEQLAEEERLRELNELIASGDLAFKNDQYEDALSIYNLAKDKAPEDDVIQQKIQITQDRIAEVEKNKFEKKVRDQLAAADAAFAARDYDEAIDLYTELLDLQPGHKKATDQIALIERIKTPASDISDLPDLGTPSLFSIIEGEALLSQAERQKEFLRLKKLRNQLTDMEQKRLDQEAKEIEETREAWAKAKGIEKDTEGDPSERNFEQWIIDQIVKERLAEMSEKEMMENILAYKELMDLQARLRIIAEQQVDGVKGNYKIPNMNEDEIKAYLKGLAGKSDVSVTNQLELLLKNEAFIHGIYNLHENDDDFSKALTSLNNLLLTSLFYDLKTTTPEQLEARQEFLEKAIASLNAYAEDINQRTDKTYSKVSGHDAYVKQIYESSNEFAQKDIDESYEARQKMLEAMRNLNDLMNEQNKEAIGGQQKFQSEVVKKQTTHLDVYMAEMLNNYLRLHQHDQTLNKMFKFDSKDYELWENDIKYAYSELKEINRLVMMENDRITEDKIKMAYRNTKDINELITEKSYKNVEDNTKQTATAKKALDADRSASDKQQANLDKAKKNIQENRALLDQLERKDFKFNDATANKLGEQFPEGVTEENFILKDDDDIVVEVKTRRIVVTNGSGSVYMRYSNRYGVTYTKNGLAITEYQWIKETQNAKLPKYKIN